MNLPGKKGMIHGLKDVITKLPTANHATPIYLLKYLKKVTGYKDVNQIAVANMANYLRPHPDVAIRALYHHKHDATEHDR